MAPSGEVSDFRDMDMSFDMERLFDHYNFDHISSEKRLHLFKQRDLSHVKFYKVAAKIFGGPSSRIRAHVAPPMETPFKHKLGLYFNVPEPPPAPAINGALKSSTEPVKAQTKEVTSKEKDEKQLAYYNLVISKRKQLRKDLESLTPNEDYLARKVDKSELEKRLHSRYESERKRKPEIAPPQEVVPDPKPAPVPIVRVPPPEGLQILDKFLSLNHMRLMDLFLTADKNKNWLLSREKFAKAVMQAEIPLTESEVDALIVTLDTDLDYQLSYQELNKGLQLWRKERRIIKRQNEKEAESKHSSKGETKMHTSSITSSNAFTESETPFVEKKKGLPCAGQNGRGIIDGVVCNCKDTLSHTAEKLIKAAKRKETSTKKARPKSHAYSVLSAASTPNSLEPPESEWTLKAWMPVSDEEMLDIRKHDRAVISKTKVTKQSLPETGTVEELSGVIKIGYKPIDDHCSESTLGGDTADMVNQFRREKLKEYFSLKNYFEQNGLNFTQQTLDRVLLYPGDKSTSEIKNKIVIPSGPITHKSSPFKKPNTKWQKGIGQQGNFNRKLGSIYRSGQRFNNKSGDVYGDMEQGFSQEQNQSGSHNYRQRRKNGGNLTVEDVYPLAASVTPKIYKKNLSSGKALIFRKVDNWMTFEEYNKYTQNLPNRFHHFNKRSNPDAAWPGYLLNKLRLYMDSDLPLVDGLGRPLENRDSKAYEGYGTGIYNGTGNAIFRHTAQPKRAYPGYNNDLLTWPVGENGVIYGNIDEHRVVK